MPLEMHAARDACLQEMHAYERCVPMRDGKVTILDKWEDGFRHVDPYEGHVL
jgi:hypothetical protein